MSILQKRVALPRNWLIPGLTAILFGSVLSTPAQSSGIAPDIRKAEELYRHTDYEGSLALLDRNSPDASMNFLIGRNYFMKGELKIATDFLLKATQEEPNNTDYMDWLGRAYGRRAETSNILSAPTYAIKARQAFERSVELDAKNSEALADLFDYYLNAPAFMGGGYEKAVAIAGKTAVIDPPEGFYEKAKLAQKRKEYETAERHLREAVAAAPNEPGHLITLARFLADRGRIQESDEVFAQARKMSPNAPRIWYAQADLLIQQKRDLEQAKALLQKYMQASLTPEDPSKQDALHLLKEAGGA